MIELRGVLLSEELLTEQFACNIAACKGGCCEDGEAGAPLHKEELQHIDQLYQDIEPLLSKSSQQEIKKQGKYVWHKDHGWVTPTIGDGICAYGIKAKNGSIQCAFQQLHIQKGSKWEKPISCHLYPLKIKRTDTFELVNYQPRKSLCAPACALGKSLKIPVYQFARKALIRVFGKSFYDELDAIASSFLSSRL